jgi:hypothetical protein
MVAGFADGSCGAPATDEVAVAVRAWAALHFVSVGVAPGLGFGPTDAAGYGITEVVDGSHGSAQTDLA